ncbi:hypothetical protein CMUS01_01066 [Colletotrichum musicola]|uniref:Uncharacterized protein n=1 Tax=Colletotrichum musicola TaxID=2175873 RepID=A0A8H6U8Y5_9PEZI|nr:hypothetical protein CMUS01_01066 [Colletotrichum musicola]
MAVASSCAHSFKMIKSDSTLIQWTCNLCHSERLTMHHATLVHRLPAPPPNRTESPKPHQHQKRERARRSSRGGRCTFGDVGVLHWVHSRYVYRHATTCRALHRLRWTAFWLLLDDANSLPSPPSTRERERDKVSPYPIPIPITQSLHSSLCEEANGWLVVSTSFFFICRPLCLPSPVLISWLPILLLPRPRPTPLEPQTAW